MSMQGELRPTIGGLPKFRIIRESYHFEGLFLEPPDFPKFPRSLREFDFFQHRGPRTQRVMTMEGTAGGSAAKPTREYSVDSGIRRWHRV